MLGPSLEAGGPRSRSQQVGLFSGRSAGEQVAPPHRLFIRVCPCAHTPAFSPPPFLRNDWVRARLTAFYLLWSKTTQNLPFSPFSSIQFAGIKYRASCSRFHRPRPESCSHKIPCSVNHSPPALAPTVLLSVLGVNLSTSCRWNCTVANFPCWPFSVVSRVFTRVLARVWIPSF